MAILIYDVPRKQSYYPISKLLLLTEEMRHAPALISHVRLFATPWTAPRRASLSHHQLPELTQTHVHRGSDAIQLFHPLSPLLLPALLYQQQ